MTRSSRCLFTTVTAAISFRRHVMMRWFASTTYRALRGYVSMGTTRSRSTMGKTSTDFGIQANIVIRELREETISAPSRERDCRGSYLAKLSVIDTKDLGLLIAPEAHARNEVEDPKDDCCHDERVSEASC